MTVLLVNGSPHEHGCTDAALKHAASVLEEQGVHTEIFWIGSKPISGCIGCGACKKGLGKCCIDDVVNEFVLKAAEADGYISVLRCTTQLSAELWARSWTGRSTLAGRAWRSSRLRES